MQCVSSRAWCACAVSPLLHTRPQWLRPVKPRSSYTTWCCSHTSARICRQSSLAVQWRAGRAPARQRLLTAMPPRQRVATRALESLLLPSLWPANGPWGRWAGLIAAGAFGLWAERNTRLGRDLSAALVATLAGVAVPSAVCAQDALQYSVLPAHHMPPNSVCRASLTVHTAPLSFLFFPPPRRTHSLACCRRRCCCVRRFCAQEWPLQTQGTFLRTHLRLAQCFAFSCHWLCRCCCWVPTCGACCLILAACCVPFCWAPPRLLQQASPQRPCSRLAQRWATRAGGLQQH